MGEFVDRKDLEASSTSASAADLRIIERASEEEKDWRERASRVEAIYLDQERQETDPLVKRSSRRFNVLWSNIQILGPAIFSGIPKPDIRRRLVALPNPSQEISERDALSRDAALILERAVSNSLDSFDFIDVLQDVLLDYLLVGRGVPRVRYVPQIGRGDPVRRTVVKEVITGPDGFPMGNRFTMPEQERELSEEEIKSLQQNDEGEFFLEEPGEEEIVGEEVRLEYVPWDDIRIWTARRWEDVPGIAFRTWMSREQLIAQYGQKGRKVHFTHDADGKRIKSSSTTESDIGPPDNLFGRAEVWEIWDKDAREMRVVTEGLPDEYLVKVDDPLRLKGFFPIPRPIYSVKGNRTLIPTPEFCLYQDLADELDRLTNRIARLIEAAKVKGLIAADMASDINRMWLADEATFIPMENFTQFLEAGGMSGAIEWSPIKEITDALGLLFQQRANLIQSIYEITGVSDIFRGATDPNETFGAQRLKSQFGSLRLSKRQAEFARMVRDGIRLMAEVIAENFSPETLSMMSNMEVTKEILEILQDDLLRNFSIDVETDTTVAADDQADKEAVSEFMATIVLPSAQAGFLKPEEFREALVWASKRFKISRELEDLLSGQATSDKSEQGRGESEPNVDSQGNTMEAIKIETDARVKAAELEIRREELQLERDKLALEERKTQADIELKRLELELKSAGNSV